MTDEGRVKMLNALRRKRADARNSKPKHRSLSLPIESVGELEALAHQTGMPLTKLLTAFAAIGRSDTKLREQLIKLAVATNLKPVPSRKK